MTRKLRNEDFSMYYFIKNTLTDVPNITIKDAYPYNEVEQGTLTLPTVSIEHTQTIEEGLQLGDDWVRRMWTIEVFAKTDTQRDEISELIYDSLNVSVPIYDYVTNKLTDTYPPSFSVDYRIQPEDRLIRPIYSFNEYNLYKFWRASITFETI